MRTLLLLVPALTAIGTYAQNGPGGVSANNVLWLRADNGITAAGAAVTAWNDNSGNGNNATPPAVAARPTFVGGARNGYPVVSFDGTDDELRVPDAGSLDMNTWDIFFVSAENIAKNNNSWLAKGTTTQPNYALWSPLNGALTLPVFDILNILSSPAAPAGTTSTAFSLLEYNNTVIAFFFPSRTVYKAGASIYNDINLLNLPAQNNHPLYIGNVQGAAGWNMDGDLAEVIIYDQPVNSAQRIIINNYLSAKYDLPHTTNNLYTQDDPGNGNYDHDVAGIGRINGSNTQTDSRGTGVVQINGATNLGNGEFLFYGHDGAWLSAVGSTDHHSSIQGRWHRVWRVSEVNTSGAAIDVGNVNITFDLTGQGSVTTGHLRLLVDLNDNGIFIDDTPLAIAATSLGGNLYRFSGVSQLINGRRFTLGTTNIGATPLPIELLSFTAEAEGSTVNLKWTTASEQNNERFTIERSADGSAWERIAVMPGAGTSNMPIDYSTKDDLPLMGLSYYRLKQTDHDGTSTYGDAVAVRMELANEILVHPNPGQDIINVVFTASGAHQVQLMDDLGRMLSVPVTIMDGRAQLDVSTVPPGCYLLVATAEQEVTTKRLVVSR